jgi:hypothetical protein
LHSWRFPSFIVDWPVSIRIFDWPFFGFFFRIKCLDKNFLVDTRNKIIGDPFQSIQTNFFPIFFTECLEPVTAIILDLDVIWLSRFGIINFYFRVNRIGNKIGAK